MSDEAASKVDAWLTGSGEPPELKEAILQLVALDNFELTFRIKRAAKIFNVRMKDLENLIEQRRPVGYQLGRAKATLAEVRQFVESLIKGKPDEAAKQQVDKAIWQFLRQHMMPFICGGLPYLLPIHNLSADLDAPELAKKGIPIAVTKDDENFNFLLIALGVHPGANVRNRVGLYVDTMCAKWGKETEARISFSYDADARAAYFAEERGFLVKVTTNEITRVPNGADNQLFLFNDHYEPWTYTAPVAPVPFSVFPRKSETGEITWVAEPDEERLWDPTEDEIDDDPTAIDLCPSDALLPRLIFHVLKFENTSLGSDELEILLNAYVMTLFLPGIITGRLLLQVLGETGSAKTLFCRLIGRLIYGKKFNVIGLDENESQVENALVNNSFIVFDDVKRTKNSNILGMIRRACTGGSCSRRELYTTFRQATEPYRASVAITCSDEPFGATDEMSNRSLIIRAAPREDFVREEKLLRGVDDNRDALMSEMMVRAKAIITAVSAQRYYEPMVKMRLASFCTFLLQVARHFEWLPAAETVLAAWKEEQEGATIDPEIAAILDRWIGRPDWETEHLPKGKPPKHFSPYELYRELAGVANALGTVPWWLGKERQLFRALRSAAHAYRNRYGFNFTARTSGHKPPEYWFEPKTEVIQRLRAEVLSKAEL